MLYEDWDSIEFHVEKTGYFLPVSKEFLMDEGLIPDTREPVKYSRWQRFKWFVDNNVAETRLRIGSWIAGVELTNWEDD